MLREVSARLAVRDVRIVQQIYSLMEMLPRTIVSIAHSFPFLGFQPWLQLD